MHEHDHRGPPAPYASEALDVQVTSPTRTFTWSAASVAQRGDDEVDEFPTVSAMISSRSMSAMNAAKLTRSP